MATRVPGTEGGRGTGGEPGQAGWHTPVTHERVRRGPLHPPRGGLGGEGKTLY